MFWLSQVTVTQVAAPLAVASALFALVFLLYGIPLAARNDARNAARDEQGTMVFSVLLFFGNIGLVVAFLFYVAQIFTLRIDPLLFPPPTPPVECVACPPSDPSGAQIHAGYAMQVARWTQGAVIAALIWYALSIVVLAIEMSAGRSRGQRRSASSESV